MPDFSEQNDLANYSGAAMGPIFMLDAATSGTSSRYQNYAAAARHIYSITWSAGVTAGAISIKWGTHTDQTEAFGEQIALSVLDAESQGADSTDTITIDGLCYAHEIEITTPVVGGTVSVTWGGRD
jgi:hypothetical protein